MSEHEKQLAEINELLEEDPNDESLLQLKQDILELISSSRSNNKDEKEYDQSSVTKKKDDCGVSYGDLKQAPSTGAENPSGSAAHESPRRSVSSSSVSASAPISDASTIAEAAVNKKSKKGPVQKPPPSNFEIPPHLIPLESDTDGERNKKRRAIKALKSKWRERVKEAAGTKKQKSWQDFMGKAKKKRKNAIGGESIFRTEDGVNARVGVIGSGKTMTEFGERKRFKM